MPLFQNSVVTKYLQAQDKVKITEKWNEFKAHFHNPTIQDNIRNSKEEQYQEGFLRDLFVKILGYTLNPDTNFNLTTELKNEKDSKKADGGIIVDDKVYGVIELKGTNTTDLNKIEVQAFGYKNNQKDCIYVITSNFEKIRFYIDNAIEHVEFNLFQLTEKEFELLYLCVAFENISKNIPKKIKEDSLSQEDKITKELYKDYSLFKNDLFHNLVALNPDYEPLELFKKSQKLLDRFLFLFFAEDRQLLPPNSVRLILDDWKDLQERDVEIPLYDRYKKYFEYLNTGYKGKRYDVFAYNGGLFKPDAILDSIKIEDNLLYEHTLKLAKYDFDSEVDVNILGHIFENSLNELDEMKAQLEGVEIDKTKTKRKKDGVFYTPKYITKYIVENTVGKLCTEKKLELQLNEEDYNTDKKRTKATKQPLLDKLTQYRNWLLQITIIDPACGSGAFLNEALNFLIEEHTYIDELQAKLFGDAFLLSDVEKSILENNLFGVDLNEESVEIAKLSLWLRTAQPNRKLNDLNSNIKCGNSLIDDPEVAGDKAFNWQNEFPQIFEKGGFDVVIGNPPYVQFNDTFYKNYETNKCGDLYALFFEKGIEINKKGGFFGFITPSLFIKGMRYESLRNFLISNTQIIEIDDLGDKVFQDVQMPTAISILKNYKIENQDWNNYIKGNNLLQKIELDCIKISEISKIMRGLEIGKDKVNLNEKDVKFLTGEDICRYGIKSISYISNEVYNEFKKDNFYFSGNRISIRETGNRITSIYIKNEDFQQNRSLYSIKLNDENVFLYEYVISIINSNIIQYFYQTKFAANTDIFPKIRIGQVKELPIKITSLEIQNNLKTKSKFIIEGLNELNTQSTKFQRTIQRKFELENLSKKLESWYLLTYSEFVKELGKKKIKLSLAQEAEWEDYFLQEQQKAITLKNEIDATDKAIDAMVYELYGLTQEEIEIVENS